MNRAYDPISTNATNEINACVSLLAEHKVFRETKSQASSSGYLNTPQLTPETSSEQVTLVWDMII